MKPLLCKVSETQPEHRMVFGWAIVCTENGELYVDPEGVHVPEEVMFDAAVEFMINSRELQAMHKGKAVGSVVCAWPVTGETLAAMGHQQCVKTGLMVGVMPSSREVLQKFKSGEYTGFSIGGEARIQEVEVQ